eukprot:COSAG05_NODE_1167_length_5631_cov_3.840383_2_plen_68_part_00
MSATVRRQPESGKLIEAGMRKPPVPVLELPRLGPVDLISLNALTPRGTRQKCSPMPVCLVAMDLIVS